MELLRLKDDDGTEEVTEFDVGGNTVFGGKGEALPCSKIIDQAPGKEFS